jgi:type I restriction enzyme S subunit
MVQISTVNIKDLNEEFRLDAEYYRAEVLKHLSVLNRHNKANLDELVDFVVGPFGSTLTADKYVTDSEYRYIRNKDINDFLISDNDPALIQKEIYETLPQFHIKENDLLITVVGTLGKVAIATTKDIKSIFSCKSTILRAKKINPFFLLAYLNSKTGQLFCLRGKRGAIQEGLNLSDLKEIQVYIPKDEKFQVIIENIIRVSFGKTDDSKYLYSQTKELLLSEIGLWGWRPKHTLSFEKKYSEAKQAERLDAEYFQSKYDDIVKVIKNYKGGWDTLGNLCELVGHPSNPPYADTGTEDAEKTFIVTQNDLGDYSLADTYWSKVDAKYTTSDFVRKNPKYILRKNDLVLYTVGAPPHIGKANIIFDEDIKATIGSFVTLVRANAEKINPFSLLSLLNSPVGYLLTNRFQRGMVQQYIYPKDLVQTPVPIPPKEVQSHIQQKISESFALRQESKRLLECAKRAVEVAIEKDEKTALQWLKANHVGGADPTKK